MKRLFQDKDTSRITWLSFTHISVNQTRSVFSTSVIPVLNQGRGVAQIQSIDIMLPSQKERKLLTDGCPVSSFVVLMNGMISPVPGNVLAENYYSIACFIISKFFF
jgi:chloramphenicol O-acetyltransferase